MSEPARQLARSLRDRSARDASRHGRGVRYAEITQKKPLVAQINNGSLSLDEEDLQFGQWARQYRKTYGLSIGDALLVHPLPDGDWAVVDVVSDKAVKRLKTKPEKGSGEEGGGEGEGGGSEAEPAEWEEEPSEDEEDENELQYTKGCVVHGEDPNVPRPEGFPSVEWIGIVDPVNAINNDTWTNPGKTIP